MSFDASRGRTAEQGVSEIDDSGSARKPGGGGGKKPPRVPKGTYAKVFTALAVLILLVVLFNGGRDYGKHFENFKSTFNSTQDENFELMIKGIKDVERSNKGEGAVLDPVYDENNIYYDESVYKQVDKEYILYVYTGKEEVDVKFNEWVRANQGKYPIYKLNRYNVLTQETILDYFGEKEEPILYVINEIDRGAKIIEDVITKPKKLKTISGTMEGLKESKRRAKEE